MTIILGLLLLLLVVASLVPVPLRRAYRTRSLYIPVAGAVCYGLYEFFMSIEIPSESVPIRVDMLFLIPMLSVILIAGLCRWGTLLYLVKRKRIEDANLAIKIQVVSFSVVALIGGTWILTWWFA